MNKIDLEKVYRERVKPNLNFAEAAAMEKAIRSVTVKRSRKAILITSTLFSLVFASLANATTYNGMMKFVKSGYDCSTIPHPTVGTGEYQTVFVINDDRNEKKKWNGSIKSVFATSAITGDHFFNLSVGEWRDKTGEWSLNTTGIESGDTFVSIENKTNKKCPIIATGDLHRGDPESRITGFWGVNQIGSGEKMEIFSMIIMPYEDGGWAADINNAQYRSGGIATELPYDRLVGSFSNGFFGKRGLKMNILWLDEVSKKMKIKLEMAGWQETMTLNYLAIGDL